ncbi:MAG: polysaccharide biosynthesis protein [Treponema sp.]|nr:polysaccharide biosynthesis protein [Treponema sp.]
MNLKIEDLLFRDVVQNDMSAAADLIEGRVVMVTGGAGSVGSELCKQVLELGCALVIVYDFNENGLYEIGEVMNEYKEFGRNRYKLCLGSICDLRRLNEVIREYKPDILFHAAAHKHVPMMELNPFEAIKNNVVGTINVVNACVQNDVDKFILISTDKAVNPVSIMGASKRVAELIVKYMSVQNIRTEFAAVRFGNVFGSSGSVVPRFKQQIDKGGPVTLTHMDMIRYFMTISEAIGLVLTAGAFAKGGEIFTLDMGYPIKIYDLAVDLIRLAGYEPEVDIKIEIVGIRPGEKLYEELFFNYETVDRTSHEKIFVLKNECLQDWNSFNNQLQQMIETAEKGKDEISLREALFALVRSREYDNKAMPKSRIDVSTRILQNA